MTATGSIAITRARALFYPRSLPRLLARFLVAEQFDEPLELWC